MADPFQNKIEAQARRVESLEGWKTACRIWLGGTVVLGPLLFLTLVGGGGGGSNTGAVFPAGGILLVIVGFPLSLLLSGLALWYFAIESRVAKARLAAAREEAGQTTSPIRGA